MKRNLPDFSKTIKIHPTCQELAKELDGVRFLSCSMNTPSTLPKPENTLLAHRKILQTGWTRAGTKGLEAVTVYGEDSTSVYYQVTHAGKEVLQTIEREAAEKAYGELV